MKKFIIITFLIFSGCYEQLSTTTPNPNIPDQYSDTVYISNENTENGTGSYKKPYTNLCAAIEHFNRSQFDGDKTIIFKNGTYEYNAEEGQDKCWHFSNIDNLVIKGESKNEDGINNVTIKVDFYNKNSIFSYINSSIITIKDLTFDVDVFYEYSPDTGSNFYLLQFAGNSRTIELNGLEIKANSNDNNNNLYVNFVDNFTGSSTDDRANFTFSDSSIKNDLGSKLTLTNKYVLQTFSNLSFTNLSTTDVGFSIDSNTITAEGNNNIDFDGCNFNSPDQSLIIFYKLNDIINIKNSNGDKFLNFSKIHLTSSINVGATNEDTTEITISDNLITTDISDTSGVILGTIITGFLKININNNHITGFLKIMGQIPTGVTKLPVVTLENNYIYFNKPVELTTTGPYLNPTNPAFVHKLLKASNYPTNYLIKFTCNNINTNKFCNQSTIINNLEDCKNTSVTDLDQLNFNEYVSEEDYPCGNYYFCEKTYPCPPENVTY